MDDLVKRLRGWPPSIAHNVMQDAADRIEVLEARIAKADALAEAITAYQEAEENAVDTSDADDFCDAFDCWDRVQEALAAYREGSDT